MEILFLIGIIGALSGVLLSQRMKDPPAVRIPEDLRNRGLRIAGEVSTGKTVLGALIACLDALAGKPVTIIDPHDSLIDNLVALVLLSPAREELLARFRYWEPARKDWIHSLPFLEHRDGRSAYEASQSFVETCHHAWPCLQEGAPVFAQIATATLMVLYSAHCQIIESVRFLRVILGGGYPFPTARACPCGLESDKASQTLSWVGRHYGILMLRPGHRCLVSGHRRE